MARRAALISVGAAALVVLLVSATPAGEHVRRLMVTDDPEDDWPSSPRAGDGAAAGGAGATEDAQTGHKFLFPLGLRDVAGFVFACGGLMIAAGGGIGGGGMLVPIYIIVLGFQPKYAIPLSNVTVLGGAITNVVFAWPKRHPHADRPLIDWDLILVMQPMQLVGALLGGFINKMAPELLLTVMLVVLLGLTAESTLKKALKMYKKESAAIAAAAARKESELTALSKESAKDVEQAEGTGLLDDTDDEPGARDKKRDGGDLDDIDAAALKSELDGILREEAQAAPAWKLQLLAAMFAAIIAINVLKGGGSTPSIVGVACGTAPFWGLTLSMLGLLVYVGHYVREYLLAQTARKARVGYKYVEGDIVWDAKGTIKYPLICIGAGMCAGLFGIGGGIVTGPLMLELGVHPKVAGASTATMILLTAFTAATSFMMFGLLQVDYGTLLFPMGIGATYAGQKILNELMKNNERNSYIAFSIGAVVAISAVFMTLQSLLSMAYNGIQPGNGGIC